MATRGIKQLKHIQIVYCEHGGSSSSIRQYLSSPTSKIISFCQSNPSVQVSTKLRNGKHPYVKAEYVSGFSKQVSIMNETEERIQKVIQMLHDSSGRKITKIGGPIKTQTPSVQGVWTPMLDIADKKFEVEMIEWRRVRVDSSGKEWLTRKYEEVQKWHVYSEVAEMMNGDQNRIE